MRWLPRLRVGHRARKSYFGGLLKLNFSNFRLTSIGSALGIFSVNSRKPGRVRVDGPAGTHAELDFRDDDELATRRRRRAR